jgi:NADH-quinone oxidoreductase subunit C
MPPPMSPPMEGPPGPRWESWSAEVGRRVAEGYDWLDLLTAVDRPRQDGIEVVIHLLRRSPAGLDHAWGHTMLDRDAPVLESVTDLLPSAAWHEREIHEMFGVDVLGHPDLCPLLLHGAEGAPPLRKDTPLVARVETPWPGADDSGRRRPQVPGVPAEWLGER